MDDPRALRAGALRESGPSFEEIAKKYKMTPTQITRYKTNNMGGEAYFRTLSMEEQRKLLGPAKWLSWKEGKFGFDQLVKTTYSPVWGEGKGVASLKDLIGEEDANYYLRLTQNGLAKQNLNAEELIKFASLDLRPLTNREVGKITNFVAERGFNDQMLQKVPSFVVNSTWDNKVIQKGDRLGSGVVHYLKHVKANKEWPDGTDLQTFYTSIKSVVQAKDVEIFISRYNGSLQIGFVGDSKIWKGPAGYDKILVEYRVTYGNLVTAFQLNDIEVLLEKQQRESLIWLRKR